MKSAELDRRTFLARLGLLGAVAGSTLVLPESAVAGVLSGSRSRTIDALRPLVADLTTDTFAGLAVFVIPGPDDYSRVQGTPRPEPGAIEACTPQFLINMFDHFLPLPPEMATGLGRALASGLAEVPVPLPDDLPALPDRTIATLDQAVKAMLTEETLPLSQLIALLLNLMATQVNPASATGPFLSPFARLAAPYKAVVFQRLEDPPPGLVEAIASQVPEELRAAVASLLEYLVGGLLAFPAFGTYGEWPDFEAGTGQSVGQLTGRPVGWELSRFDPGVLDGWRDFKGYYQGRREAS